GVNGGGVASARHVERATRLGCAAWVDALHTAVQNAGAAVAGISLVRRAAARSSRQSERRQAGDSQRGSRACPHRCLILLVLCSAASGHGSGAEAQRPTARRHATGPAVAPS